MSHNNKISVCVRCRPLTEREKQSPGELVQVEGNAFITGPTPGSTFTFDRVFTESCSNNDLYEDMIRPLIADALKGINGTVFAYGQTGSGKTHTIQGDDQEPGIMPRAITELFNVIDHCKDRQFLLHASYIEIYNEELRDLLSAVGAAPLKLRQTPDGNFEAHGLSSVLVNMVEEVMELQGKGMKRRMTGQTLMNARSSRSHSIFRLVIESASKDNQGTEGDTVKMSSLNFVDLAGSERQQKTGAQGERLKEANAINKSLLVLSSVIHKLSEDTSKSTKKSTKHQAQHIPYRDSNLTRLLKQALGGNSNTVSICAVTRAAMHRDETISTLRFAARCSMVVNSAVVNEKGNSEGGLLKRFQREVAELQARLAEAHQAAAQAATDGSISKELAQMESDKQEQEVERERLERKVQNLLRLLSGSRASSSVLGPGTGTHAAASSPAPPPPAALAPAPRTRSSFAAFGPKSKRSSLFGGLSSMLPSRSALGSFNSSGAVKEEEDQDHDLAKVIESEMTAERVREQMGNARQRIVRSEASRRVEAQRKRLQGALSTLAFRQWRNQCLLATLPEDHLLDQQRLRAKLRAEPPSEQWRKKLGVLSDVAWYAGPYRQHMEGARKQDTHRLQNELPALHEHVDMLHKKYKIIHERIAVLKGELEMKELREQELRFKLAADLPGKLQHSQLLLLLVARSLLHCIHAANAAADAHSTSNQGPLQHDADEGEEAAPTSPRHVRKAQSMISEPTYEDDDDNDEPTGPAKFAGWGVGLLFKQAARSGFMSQSRGRRRNVRMRRGSRSEHEAHLDSRASDSEWVTDYETDAADDKDSDESGDEEEKSSPTVDNPIGGFDGAEGAESPYAPGRDSVDPPVRRKSTIQRLLGTSPLKGFMQSKTKNPFKKSNMRHSAIL